MKWCIKDITEISCTLMMEIYKLLYLVNMRPATKHAVLYNSLLSANDAWTWINKMCMFIHSTGLWNSIQCKYAQHTNCNMWTAIIEYYSYTGICWHWYCIYVRNMKLQTKSSRKWGITLSGLCQSFSWA